MNILAQTRKNAGFTQAELAEKLKLHQQDVSKYENCIRRLDVVEFLEVCHVLNVNYADILRDIQIHRVGK